MIPLLRISAPDTLHLQTNSFTTLIHWRKIDFYTPTLIRLNWWDTEITQSFWEYCHFRSSVSPQCNLKCSLLISALSMSPSCWCFYQAGSWHNPAERFTSTSAALFKTSNSEQKIFLKTHYNVTTTELCFMKFSNCATFEHSHECTLNSSKSLQEILVECCMGEVSPAALLEAVWNILPEFITNQEWGEGTQWKILIVTTQQWWFVTGTEAKKSNYKKELNSLEAGMPGSEGLLTRERSFPVWSETVSALFCSHPGTEASGRPLGSRGGLVVAYANTLGIGAGASFGICLWCIFQDPLWNHVFQQESAHIFKHKCVLNLPQQAPQKFPTNFFNSSQVGKKKKK